MNTTKNKIPKLRFTEFEGEFEKDKLIDISKYSRIFELVNFVVTDSNNFDCTIKLTSNIHSEEKQIIFDQNTNPAKFRI